METTGGGRVLKGVLEDLEKRLADYFGMLNLVRAGLKIKPNEVVEKPPELKKYEQMVATGLPVWAGGLQDQPHIWLEMVGVIIQVKTTFERLAKANQPEN